MKIDFEEFDDGRDIYHSKELKNYGEDFCLRRKVETSWGWRKDPTVRKLVEKMKDVAGWQSM